VNVSDLVRGEVAARFSHEDASVVQQKLTTTGLPFLDQPNRDRERDRVHLAILKLADGNLERFEKYLTLSARDWRDLLMTAGMANGDWPDVLRAAGFPVP
jgi:hypothetical protein